jgi:hypothetical protein
MTPAERPSRMVHGARELTLTARGCALVLAALELALRNAPPGYRFAAEHGDSDFAWLRHQCRLVAGQAPGQVSASGQQARPFTVTMPPSDVPLGELLTARQAAPIIGVSARQVGRMIDAGLLPGRKVGREWITTNYAARHAAGRNGRRDGAHDAGNQPRGPAPGERGRQ